MSPPGGLACSLHPLQSFFSVNDKLSSTFQTHSTVVQSIFFCLSLSTRSPVPCEVFFDQKPSVQQSFLFSPLRFADAVSSVKFQSSKTQKSSLFWAIKIVSPSFLVVNLAPKILQNLPPSPPPRSIALKSSSESHVSFRLCSPMNRRRRRRALHESALCRRTRRAFFFSFFFSVSNNDAALKGSLRVCLLLEDATKV